MSKSTWILGAGFSQPLGGPLLENLFRLDTRHSCDATFPKDVFPGLADSLLGLQTGFDWGRTQASYWDDAEQFLGFIDDAYAGSDPIKRTKLEGLVREARRPNWSDTYDLRIADFVPPERLLVNLDRIARRALAAQCECFLFNRSPKDEEAWLASVEKDGFSRAKSPIDQPQRRDAVAEIRRPSRTLLEMPIGTDQVVGVV